MEDQEVKINSFFSENGAGGNKSGLKPSDIVYKSKKNEDKLGVRIMDSIITVCLVAIFFGLPIFFTGATFQGVAFEKQIFFYFWMLLAIIAWAVKGVLVGEFRIRKTPLDLFIGIFWLSYVVSTSFSFDRWHSFWGFWGDPSRGLVNVTALILAYYMIFSNFTPRRFKLMLSAVLVSSALLSIWIGLGVLGIKFLPQRIADIVPLSPFGSLSATAAFFSMMLPLILTVLFTLNISEPGKPKELWKKLLTFGLVLLLLLQIFLLSALYGFVGWPALLIGIGFLLIYIISRVMRPSGGWSWVPLIVFAFLMILLLLGDMKIPRINLPFEVSPNLETSWQIAKDSLKDRFIIGSGPATYGIDFSSYRPQNLNMNILYNIRFYQGTGMILESMSTLGALGALALLLLLLSFISVSLYLLTRERAKNKLYSLGFFSAALIFIVNGLLSRTEGPTLLFGVLLSFLAFLIIIRESDSIANYLVLSTKASPRFALSIGFLFIVLSSAAIFMFIFLGRALAADIYAGRSSKQGIGSEEAVRKLERAVSLYDREGRYFTYLGQKYLELANLEMAKPEGERDIEKAQDFLNKAITNSSKGKDLMGKDVLAVESLAQVFENALRYNSDSLRLAQDNYQRGAELEPNNPLFYAKLAQLKISEAVASQSKQEQGQLYLDARNLAQKAIDEKNDLALAHYVRALSEKGLDDLGSAIDYMKRAALLDVNNINYAYNLGRLHQLRNEGEDNKSAELIYRQILRVNDREINTHFSLGMLLEDAERKAEAKEEYQKVLDLLPPGSDEASQKISTMISNLDKGIKNTEDGTLVSEMNQTPNSGSAQSQAAPSAASPTVKPINPSPASNPTTTNSDNKKTKK